MKNYADARPTRRFFIDMLTADIALEDALLDLIDNAIDALVRNKNLDLSEHLLFANGAEPPPTASISIRVNDKEVVIEDNCGGIEKHDALANVFRIGRVIPQDKASLGVYGIGLKRAIFKVGNAFELESKTTTSGFVAALPNIDDWADEDTPDWEIPIRNAPAAQTTASAGTRIRIWQLREPIRKRIQEGTLLKSLQSAVARTYPLFLSRFVNVWVGDMKVVPEPLPVAGSDRVAPAVERLTIPKPEVRATLLAGIASLDADEWSATRAGWYIICNGRVVVSADKTELTGWGSKLLPQFHSKYRPFIGVAFFFSEHPAALPWTTTKRGINRDSVVFQTALPQMATVARQVLAFLNRLYPGDLAEAPAERDTAASVKQLDVRHLAQSTSTAFKAEVRKKRAKQTTKIQFDVTLDELNQARRCIGKPGWPGVKIGRYAFDYLLRNEGRGA